MPRLKAPSEAVTAFIREYFWYDAARGRVEWLREAPSGRSQPGDDIGTLREDGYRYVYVKGQMVSALSIAAYFRDGKWPEGRVKPVNGQRDDLRPENIRIGDSDHAGAIALARRVRKVADGAVTSADPFDRIPKPERISIMRDLDLSMSETHNDPVFRRHALVNALDWIIPGGYRRRHGYMAHSIEQLERLYDLFS